MSKKRYDVTLHDVDSDMAKGLIILNAMMKGRDFVTQYGLHMRLDGNKRKTCYVYYDKSPGVMESQISMSDFLRHTTKASWEKINNSLVEYAQEDFDKKLSTTQKRLAEYERNPPDYSWVFRSGEVGLDEGDQMGADEPTEGGFLQDMGNEEDGSPA